MKFVDVTAERVRFIGNNLRPADTTEVGLSHGCNAMTAVIDSWRGATFCKVIEGDNGNPVGISGLCGSRIFLLGTPELTATKNHRQLLISQGRDWVQKLIQIAQGPVHNWAYAKNRTALKYLKHLGFEISRPAPYGPSCALFCHFWRDF